MRESQIVQKLNESSLSYRWTWVEKMFNKKYFFSSGSAESLPIIKKIIELPKCTRSGGSRYIIMEFNSYINNFYRNVPYSFKGFNNPK